MSRVYLALGSNLGNRQKNIQSAIEKLSARGITVKKISTVIETKPVGGPPQGKFLNAVLRAETSYSSDELLAITLSIEKKLGRKRTIKNGPRTIDIDILLYDNQTINTDELILPHPRMLEREFVMKPLKEISPELVKELQGKNS
ncbi:MAG: 2-amino-4-hydroxy-6-hydroxymethyldihydropteridine diphosphokinase [Candidatus Aceula meridiana]|nr:2-amino-4-hydroxy-6-hydroxymethyldihydropteridine diphosphokinase [Candidatus Aceula meridiana]